MFALERGRTGVLVSLDDDLLELGLESLLGGLLVGRHRFL